MDCVILANGEFCTHKIALKYLKNADILLVCDGAIFNLANFDLAAKIKVVIGDFDSLKDAKNEKNFSDFTFIRKKEQNSNDLTKALKFALKFSPKNIIILGAGGKRDDHAMLNFSLLSEFLRTKNRDNSKPKIKMITNYGELFCVQNDCEFGASVGEQISLFCFDKKAKFSSRGLKYELKNFTFRHFAAAALNEAKNSQIYIQNPSNANLFIYKNFFGQKNV